jgi:outer membrane receptor for ferrienterochelin and colicin
MSARRKSTRLAMAVSSILAAPAMVAGFGLAAGLAFAPEVRAQETSAQIAGVVVDADGAAVAGAEVKVLHVPSGTTSTAVTNASGQFSVSGLRVGGPYTVTAMSEGNLAAAVENVYAELGRRPSLTLSLAPAAQLAEVQVTAAGMQSTAVGVGTEFSAEVIASAPSIDRDLKSTLRIDPKAWVDPTNSDALEVAGVNNRYNSFTVDGIRQNDDFGLNNNGYPTQRSPISLDAVEAVSLLSAPFDVQYSGFRGSTINVVTKSGTNEFHGSAFYYKYDDSMVGDKSKDRKFDFTFSEKKYGGTFGGPIIKDKLFFFLSYEKLESDQPNTYGPVGSGAPIETNGITQAEYDQIVQITKDVYGFDPGTRLSSLPVTDEKYLAKLDWNIADTQRASFSYQHTEGNEIIQTNNYASSGTGSDLSTPSDWYNRKITMDTYSLQLFSDWSDTFKTELKIGRKEIETLQDSLGGTDFALFRVTTPSGGEVFIGPDVYRQANYLTNNADQLKLKGSWFLGDHTVALGYEREQLDIFNLFVPYSTGEYYFSSIANYQARTAYRLNYSNAYTNNSADNGAQFKYNVDSVYLQDSWRVTPEFEVQAGVRYEMFSSSDKPKYNANFEARYGFDNQETLDGRDLFMPRLGFNWQVDDETLLRGGVGLFGGGTPNVWVSNSYSNDGVTYVAAPSSATGTPDALTNVDGYMIDPTVQASLKAGDGQVSAIDPNFKIPSSWRYDLGIEHYFPGEWKMTADLMYSEVKDEVMFQDLRLNQTGVAPDGRPIYGYADETCANPDPTHVPPYPAPTYCPQRPKSYVVQDILLTNTSKGRSTIFTIDLSKNWQTVAGDVGMYVGYGHQDVTDVNPGTSSIASSNWKYLATDDINNPGAATSNYEIEHRFTLALNWKKAFFGDAYTSAALFIDRRSGRHYSYTYGRGTNAFGDPQSYYQRNLFYVPLVDDPLVTYSTPAFEQAVNDFIDSNNLSKYRGQIAPRNGFSSPWVTTADLKLAQEIPLGWKDLRGVLTLDILNVANLINNKWGQYSQVGFPYVAPVLDATLTADGSQFVYKPISGSSTPQAAYKSVSALPSVWRIQLGFRIEF